MTHPTIQGVKAALHRGEITADEARTNLAYLVDHVDLAAHIIETFTKGWVTNYNLGLNHEGRKL